jgi:hypothetical protein
LKSAEAASGHRPFFELRLCLDFEPGPGSTKQQRSKLRKQLEYFVSDVDHRSFLNQQNGNLTLQVVLPIGNNEQQGERMVGKLVPLSPIHSLFGRHKKFGDWRFERIQLATSTEAWLFAPCGAAGIADVATRPVAGRE